MLPKLKTKEVLQQFPALPGGVARLSREASRTVKTVKSNLQGKMVSKINVDSLFQTTIWPRRECVSKEVLQTRRIAALIQCITTKRSSCASAKAIFVIRLPNSNTAGQF